MTTVDRPCRTCYMFFTQYA